MSTPGLPLPQYSLREEFASSFIHGVGLLLGIAGLVLLVLVAARGGDAAHVASVAIYGTTLVLVGLTFVLNIGAILLRIRARRGLEAR